VIPYSCQQITEDDISCVTAVLRSEYLTQGAVLHAFEAAFAQRHATAHAVAVSNATAGLHLACLALGIGPGKRVWTSPNSFVASANCALYCGAEVDFVDIDPVSRNLCIHALKNRLTHAHTQRALPDLVIPVDFAGVPADLRELRALADTYGFAILEDASHATGASYLGRPVGAAWADATVFSFHAVKVITTAEGGMVTTQRADVAERLRALRSHGLTRDPVQMHTPPEGAWIYEQHSLGFNARMTELQAALGLSQLGRLDSMHARRTALAARYDALLEGLPLKLPHVDADRVSAWHLYVVTLQPLAGLPSRAEVFARLRAEGIGVNVHYIPIHTQPYYAARGFAHGDFPQAEHYYAHALTLPLYPGLSDLQQDQVVRALHRALAVH
jgi:UDP-4-amino-4,6-dideoxy-N-acetyl-beta-L-altrosamine transaminase